jgi:hypothetical protein
MSEVITTIYVRIVDEDVATARIVPAQLLGEQVYKILLPDDYDPDDGEWEFLPGDKVRCISTKWDKEEPINLAIEKIG